MRLDAGALAALGPGAHFATVDALDASDAARGPLFSLPITVVVPEEPPREESSTAAAALPVGGEGVYDLALELSPGVPARRFLAVPETAEWAEVTLKTGALPEGPHGVILHGTTCHSLCSSDSRQPMGLV